MKNNTIYEFFQKSVLISIAFFSFCGTIIMYECEKTEEGAFMMLKSHEKFHSANGKRLVLVAEDEEINRELLGEILRDDYEVIFAADGIEAHRLIQEHQSTLSIVLLDLIMPGMSGLELLQTLKDDHSLQLIPVIVLTSDQESEIKSLTLGAADFIPKPYPAPGVILARIRRTIELFEDRLTIQTTERDPLTNLYNREFFYHYAELFDQYHESMEMDAIIIDIYHFRVINERFGNAYGDEILRRIGLKVREMVADTGGIVCRREADTFMVYCPHGKDYKQILESASRGLSSEDIPISRIRLRMGVYAKVDRTIPIERRFDRAKMAVDMIRNSYTKTIEIYDHKLHEREVFEQQLVESFHQAIQDSQFKVYYQPKFDVRGDIPVLTSAEALVRWVHPQFGFISPGQFIPLFENNGLIEELDLYVWKKVAAQVRAWKESCGFSVPISVNVSRVDMYDPHLVDTIRNILMENGLDPYELPLEVTESAYTQDSDQIISTVNYLRKCGFRIEMDDFGNGYSSLNMLSTLPIDALKLDMDFVQNAFRKRNDTRMLEIIIDIANYLDVPVIAEGVETEEQCEALKAIGCDIVQGYYFSKPITPDEFETHLHTRKAQLPQYPLFEYHHDKNTAYSHVSRSLTGGYEIIYYVDTLNDHYVEFLSEGQRDDLRIDKTGHNFFDEIQATIERNVHPDDRAELIRTLTKPALLSELDRIQPLSITFRMMIDDEPVYYALRAVRTPDNQHHIVIGLSNIDHELKTSGALELIHPNAVNFSGLAQALTIDMESIYYIDIQTNSYLDFHTDKPSISVPITLTQQNFFKEYPRAILPYIYHTDQNKLTAALDKSNLLEHLRSHRTLVLNFRVLIDGTLHYYRMKAIHANPDDRKHIIIGMSNIDDQITAEEKQQLEQQDALTFAGIAKALARDYFTIYIVNTKTDKFHEYNADPRYRSLGIEQKGTNFFELSRKNAEKTIYPEDLPRFLANFTKTNILNALQTESTFTITYRLLIEDRPTYVNMKISPLSEEDSNQIVVGINNIQAGMDRRAQTLPFTTISKALAGNYTTIYYLDTQTDDYIEFQSQPHKENLEVHSSGTNFFDEFPRALKNRIHPDDELPTLKQLDRDNFYEQLAAGRPIIITYRQLQNNHWSYVQLKATGTENNDDTHIIIGISDIDEQIRREEQQAEAHRLANLDNLTGVRSRQHFLEDEKQINTDILNGTTGPFAVVCCDMNSLKEINDTYGHAEGDEFIKQAARTISHVYKNSPVYRIGSDQFAVILRGDDYNNREYLSKMITALNHAQPVGRRVIIAHGKSDYDPQHDTSLEQITQRAQAAMQENKKELKIGDRR